MISSPIDASASRASLELLIHISRELSSALDLRTLLKRILFLSLRNLGALSGSIIVLDENGVPFESAIIVDNVIHQGTTTRLQATIENGLAGWVIRHRQTALVTDTTKDKRWLVRQYEEDQQPGPKSAISVPLLTRDILVGVITLAQPGTNYFNTEHVALVQAIADQAAVAVLNARLYGESQRQARVMTALARSANKISISLNLDDVLQGILEQTSLALDAQAVALALIDPMDGQLVLRAAISAAGYKTMDFRFRMGQGLAGWVAQRGEGVAIKQADQDPRYDPDIDKINNIKVQSIASAPVQYHGQVIGAIEAFNPAEGFHDSDIIMLLSGIGSLAGTSISHAQLFEKLQSAHQSYRELFEDSIDPIIITNWEGMILESNRRAMVATDYTKEELKGMHISVLHSLPMDLLGDYFANLRDGQMIVYESILTTRTGHVLPIEVDVRLVHLEKLQRIQWIIRDLSERKKLDTLRNDLTSMIYHDLRSPLANVMASIDVLKTMLVRKDDHEFKSLLDIALRSTERIQRLTDSLLDMNQLDSGKAIVNLQPVQVKQLIQEAVDTISPLVANKNQTISLDLDQDLPRMMVDPDMIRRVIINLIENAVKYTQHGGQIRVGSHKNGDFVCVWVEDNGPGIPASEHERIFDKFSRMTLDESIKGMGLGLAYCRLAVQGHGGKIWVESEPGSGSRFSFLVPVAKESD